MTLKLSTALAAASKYQLASQTSIAVHHHCIAVAVRRTIIRFQHAVYDDDLPPPLNLIFLVFWMFIVVYSSICAAATKVYTQRKRIL